MSVVKKSISLCENDLVKLDLVCKKCAISLDLPLSTKIRCLINFLAWEKCCYIDDEKAMEDRFLYV